LSCIAKYRYSFKKDRIMHFLKDTLIILVLIVFTFFLLLFNTDSISNYGLDKENYLFSCMLMLVIFSGISISIDTDLFFLKRYSDPASFSHKKKLHYFITFAFMFWGSILNALHSFQLFVPTLVFIVLIKAGYRIRGIKKVENHNLTREC
jgi:hypothetical protein